MSPIYLDKDDLKEYLRIYNARSAYRRKYFRKPLSSDETGGFNALTKELNIFWVYLQVKYGFIECFGIDEQTGEILNW